MRLLKLEGAQCPPGPTSEGPPVKQAQGEDWDSDDRKPHSWWWGPNSNNVATLECKPLVAQLLGLLLFLFLVFDVFSSENQKSEFYVTCSTAEIWPNSNVCRVLYRPTSPIYGREGPWAAGLQPLVQSLRVNIKNS